jgi:hypothetical protein
MKVRSAIKKVKAHFKKQGINIAISHPVKHGNHRYTFQHNGYVGSFFANGHDGYSEGWEDADAINFHIRRSNDHSDIQSDYYAGSFRSNITQVCESLLSSLPKYPAGTLVRGKQTKRARRWGFSDKVGLVIDTNTGNSDYVTVQWVGNLTNKGTTVSFRDLEIAK